MPKWSEITSDERFDKLSPGQQWQLAEDFFAENAKDVLQPGTPEYQERRVKFMTDIMPTLRKPSKSEREVARMGTLERVGKGFLGEVEDLAIGAMQRSQGLGRAFGFGTEERGERLKKLATERERIKKPLYETTEGTAGRVLPTLMFPQRKLATAILQGLFYGGLQPETEERSLEGNMVQNAAEFGIGNLGGRLLEAGVGRIISPSRGFRRQTEADRLRSMRVANAEDQGFRLPLSARTGGKPSRMTEAVTENLPITAIRAQKFREFNQAQANRILSNRFGRNAEVISRELIGSAKDRIGAVFDRLARVSGVIHYDWRAFSDMHRLAMETDMLPSRYINDKVRAVLDDFYYSVRNRWRSGRVTMDARKWKAGREVLSDWSRKLYRNSPNSARRINRVIEIMDNAAERSLPEGYMPVMREARRRWQAVRIAEESINKKTGNVVETKLERAIERHIPREGRHTFDPYRRLADSMDLLEHGIKTSGSAERIYWQQFVQNPYTALAGVGAGLYLNPTATAIGIGTPMLLQQAVLGQGIGRYLANTAASKPAAQAFGRGLRQIGVPISVGLFQDYQDEIEQLLGSGRR